MCDRAVILAGGRGTRLRPYTVVLPKPLMPIGQYPILEVIVRQLAHYGFRRITMAVNHQADIIKAFFGDGRRWNVSIEYSVESGALSTIGPLRLIQDLPEDFLLMNGDVLSDLHLRDFFEAHVAKHALFSIAASGRRQIIDYGVLEVNSENMLTGFAEKPAVEHLVSMGIYTVNRSLIQSLPEGKYGFDDLMIDLLSRRKPVRVVPHAGYWLDIGRPDDYMKAIEEFELRQGELIPNGG